MISALHLDLDSPKRPTADLEDAAIEVGADGVERFCAEGVGTLELHS